jgi:hypothetical protein
MRFLILLAICYIGYRYLKSWIASNMTNRKSVAGNVVRNIDDVMIKDPLCGVYFPRKDGVTLKLDGSDLIFCSKQCRDKYLATNFKQTS